MCGDVVDTVKVSTPPVLRRLNAQAVLDVLLADPAVGAAAVGDAAVGDAGATGDPPWDATRLMAATGLSRPTVHDVCDDLITIGLAVERSGPSPTGPGRRARRYALCSAAAHVVGVDMGEATVRVAVADLRGVVVGGSSRNVPDPTMAATARLGVLRGAVAAALTAAGVTPDGVRAAAVGVPAPVTAGGRAVAVDSYLPGLAAVDLRSALRPLLTAPVTVENDANLAVIGERWRGAAAGCDDAVLLLAGERLGAGLCLGGRLVRGFAGGAGEMGFLDLVTGVGDTDGIGRLVRLATGRPAPAVFGAARAGNADALAALDAVTDRVGRAVAVLATLLDPQVIVLGGAVAEAGDVLMVPLTRAYTRALRERPLRATPPLVASTLADRGAVLGAVRTALDRLLPTLLDPVQGP